MGIERFIEAQNELHDSYNDALTQIQRGRKVGHWVWYIFPQLKGLGRSYYSEYYGINGLEEAKEYLSEPVLKARLIEISNELLKHDAEIDTIMGSHIDAMKLRSSMTLFLLADESIDVFSKVLEKFFHGEKDKTTVKLLNL